MKKKNVLRKYAGLAIFLALLTMAIKTLAWWMTDSVGMLSDALESSVNFIAAIVMYAMLTLAAKPADDDHPHGQTKAEYFSSGLEGGLIFIAALMIAWAAISRFFIPQPLESIGAGIAVSILATVINLIGALILRSAGRRYNSIALEADAQHLLSDVWTSGGVLIGVALAGYTGKYWLDPLVALVVALHITFIGYSLLSRSLAGLLDKSISPAEIESLESVLSKYRAKGIDFHAVRTRQAGTRSFVTMHILVPGAWSVQQAHDLCERVESEISQSQPHIHVTTHVEPIEDPLSHDDDELRRAQPD